MPAPGGAALTDRTFTRAEANALLPSLRPLLEQVQALRRESLELDEELKRLHWKARGNGHDDLDEPLSQIQRRRERVVATLGEHVDRIHAMGVLVKDLDTGLVDFPWMRDDTMAYLCWRLGEPAVDWWHDIESGFAGRRRLDE